MASSPPAAPSSTCCVLLGARASDLCVDAVFVFLLWWSIDAFSALSSVCTDKLSMSTTCIHNVNPAWFTGTALHLISVITIGDSAITYIETLLIMSWITAISTLFVPLSISCSLMNSHRVNWLYWFFFFGWVLVAFLVWLVGLFFILSPFNFRLCVCFFIGLTCVWLFSW